MTDHSGFEIISQYHMNQEFQIRRSGTSDLQPQAFVEHLSTPEIEQQLEQDIQA